jgi:hypothetical protein
MVTILPRARPRSLLVCRKKQSESTFSNNAFEKALKLGPTFRGMNTIKKLAAKIRPVDW